MERFQADFDPATEETLACWVVVEWTHVNDTGSRMGMTVAKFYGSDAKEQAIALAEEKQTMWEEEQFHQWVETRAEDIRIFNEFG